jgi:hypothetical protein
MTGVDLAGARIGANVLPDPGVIDRRGRSRLVVLRRCFHLGDLHKRDLGCDISQANVWRSRLAPTSATPARRQARRTVAEAIGRNGARSERRPVGTAPGRNGARSRRNTSRCSLAGLPLLR